MFDNITRLREDNRGGGKFLEFSDVDNVLTYPTIRQEEAVDAIVYTDTTKVFFAQFTEETLQFKEQTIEAKGSNGYRTTLEAVIPKDRLEILQMARKFIDKRVVVVYHDENGNRRLFGSKKEPAVAAWKADHQKQFSQRNEYVLTLKLEHRAPAPYYNAPLPSISFFTDAVGAPNIFDPQISMPIGPQAQWDLADLPTPAQLFGNDINYVFIAGGNKQVTLSVINLAFIETIKWNQDGIGSTLDLSDLVGLKDEIDVSRNAPLIQLTVPANNNEFNNFLAFQCSLVYFDIKPLARLTRRNGVTVDLSNNGLGTADVNHFLVDLDTISVAGIPPAGTIKIDGTNAAPDGGTGGFDGLAAKASLQGKGFTVTTN